MEQLYCNVKKKSCIRKFLSMSGKEIIFKVGNRDKNLTKYSLFYTGASAI